MSPGTFALRRAAPPSHRLGLGEQHRELLKEPFRRRLQCRRQTRRRGRRAAAPRALLSASEGGFPAHSGHRAAGARRRATGRRGASALLRRAGRRRHRRARDRRGARGRLGGGGGHRRRWRDPPALRGAGHASRGPGPDPDRRRGARRPHRRAAAGARPVRADSRRRRTLARASLPGGGGHPRAAGGGPCRRRARHRADPIGPARRGVGARAMTAVLVAVAIVLTLALAVAGASIRILREYERAVVFRLGRLIGGKGPGIVLLIPLIDRMVRVDLRTIAFNVPPQDLITRDNVPAKVNAVTYFRVVDPVKSVVDVELYRDATSQIAQTTLRSVLGKAELDTLLSERERLNESLQRIIDEQTEPWGVKVSTVEIKDVEIPSGMQRARPRQAEAERERRAKIINAEGEFQAAERLFDAAV